MIAQEISILVAIYKTTRVYNMNNEGGIEEFNLKKPNKRLKVYQT